ncbi:MAG: ATP-binding protein [Opitutaceae bacterium]|nr:ATP-binding protein [Opitutaceae bacterium]
MRWTNGKRTFGVYAVLFACALAVCLWQRAEHLRFERAAAQALINRGRDITSTLGVVVRSQRRFGSIVPKDRIESALQDLIRHGELESIAILGATGETIASAGRPVVLTPEMLRARGVYWSGHTLTLMNLMDLGPTPALAEDQPARTPAAIVVPDPRVFRSRRPADTFGRPAWMSKEEYESVIQKQGVHSLVVSLSTTEMRQAVRTDLLLRATVSVMAAAAAFISALAWRNVGKNAELQIRLVKAGEMNAHLAQMNLAAAGLAHETRNPLNLIRGHAQMIAMQPEAPVKLKEHASTIIEEADRVTVQLNEFIHFSKPREAHLAPVEISRLVADVTRTLQPDIEEKQIRLEQSDTPLTIEADEPLFRQALFNLLLNAVQAVGTGGRVGIHWSTTAGRAATLEVRDDGPGVPPAERTSIFKPYVTMRPKGVGLGLAIVHQIVSAHGWEIACLENQPRGAVFRMSRLRPAGSAAA